MNMFIEHVKSTIKEAVLTKKIGYVSKTMGLLIESNGPLGTGIDEVCEIIVSPKYPPILAQVVGFNEGKLLLMALGSVAGLLIGSRVIATGKPFSVSVGQDLLGRVINAFGKPIDEAGQMKKEGDRQIRNMPIPPLQRTRINTLLETGVKAIDALLPIGYGQRLSIMAGSGVGKSTLLGMLVKNSVVDVIIVALIGERGREVLEFIESILGKEGLSRSVVVVATADEPALVREAAVLTAMTLSEYYRDQGKTVLLILDSLTRYAMARREIGLAIGEPATSRGYTPSVFSELASLLERCGTRKQGGSITGLFTVLVEGDDIHDPIADSVRGIVDGHIVLSRELANQGHFPAISVLESISRLAIDLMSAEEVHLMKACRQALNVLQTNKDFVELGVYKKGDNPELDRILEIKPQLEQFLQQAITEKTSREQALQSLKKIIRAINMKGGE